VRLLIAMQALGITCVAVFDGGINAAKGPERALRRCQCQPPPPVPTAAEHSQAEELCRHEAPSGVGGTHNLASEQGRPAEDEDFVHGRLHEALKCELARRGFRYLVSPMEADSQMAYLLLMSYLQVLFTEDSVLLAHLGSYPHARIFMGLTDDWKDLYDVRVGDLFQTLTTTVTRSSTSSPGKIGAHCTPTRMLRTLITIVFMVWARRPRSVLFKTCVLIFGLWNAHQVASLAPC